MTIAIENNKTYIIAEAGVNHNGNIDMAKQLIDVAAAAGVDAVKFQTFKADNLVSRSALKAEYQIRTTDADESQYEMIRKLELDKHDHEILIEYCKKREIEFLSTPFDHESVDMLVKHFDLPLIKIPSGEITNAPLLWEIAKTGKAVILSTGMSTLGEIEDALGVLASAYIGGGSPSVSAFRASYCSDEGQDVLKAKVTLLHCTTEYPTPFNEVNLKAMDTMRHVFGLPVGFSDHTPGIAVAIAAVARGAEIIEKHFTLDRNLPGPDHAASLEPHELKEMVDSIRNIEKALGDGRKIPTASELKNIVVARKSLVAACRIEKGKILSRDNLAAKRPGSGISPMQYWNYIGRKMHETFEKDEPIA